MYTEIMYLNTSINKQRKYENSPFWWQFDAFQFGILHSYGDDIFAGDLPHSENAITNRTQTIRFHDS